MLATGLNTHAPHASFHPHGQGREAIRNDAPVFLTPCRALFTQAERVGGEVLVDVAVEVRLLQDHGRQLLD